MATKHQEEYYHKQRLDAESKADSGDREAAKTATRINRKTGNTEKAGHYADIATFGKTGAKISEGISKASNVAGTLAASLEGGKAAGAALKGAKALIPAARNAVGKIASRFMPKAAAAAGAAAKEGSKPQAAERAGAAVKTAGRKIKSLSDKGREARSRNYRFKPAEAKSAAKVGSSKSETFAKAQSKTRKVKISDKESKAPTGGSKLQKVRKENRKAAGKET
jgi:hypothetical protein